MKYFLHDSSSFEDEKISILFMEFGYEGLGLFYTILEKLAKQEKPINTKVLKMQLKVGKKLEKCWSFMEEIGIISSNNGETFNKRLIKFGESMDKKRENTSKRVSQYRDNQKDAENVTRYNDVSNAPNLTKHNLTKEDTKVSIPLPDFHEKEDPKKRTAFKPPSAEEIEFYLIGNYQCSIQAAKEFSNKFWSHYNANGWKVGKVKMVSWQSAISGTWKETRENIFLKYPQGANSIQQRRRYLNDPSP